jgi:hypothetical protein
VSQRVGLSRTCAGDNQEGRRGESAIGQNAVLDSAALLRIEFVEIGCRHRESFSSSGKARICDSYFVRNPWQL